MKKALLVCFTVLFIVGTVGVATAAGAREKAPAVEIDNPLENAAVKDGEPLYLGFIANEVRSGWMSAGTGYLESLWERAGGRFTYFVSEYDLALEQSQVDDLMELGPDAILVHPSDSYAIAPAIQNAQNRGFPVFAVDVGVEGAPIHSFVTIEQEDLGWTCARYIEEQFSADNPAKVLHLTGGLEQDIAVKRRAGFNDHAAKFDYIEIVQEIDTKWSADTAMSATMDALERNPEINAIYCHSDFFVQGIVEGLRQRNRLFPAGEEGHIVITSIDGDPNGLKLMREGYIDAIAEHSPVQHMAVIVNIILGYLHGYDIPELVLLEPPLITHENVDSNERWGNLPSGRFDEWPVLQQDFYELPESLQPN